MLFVFDLHGTDHEPNLTNWVIAGGFEQMSSRATGLICCCCILLCLVSAATARVLLDEPSLLSGENMLEQCCGVATVLLSWQLGDSQESTMQVRRVVSNALLLSVARAGQSTLQSTPSHLVWPAASHPMILLLQAMSSSKRLKG